ncbi:GDP-D-glucose phosphorylase 1 [Coccomyxa sp. Obi]|nr:GDP-D-glucose phosphorylase 1 [Coccomyxa sp. Obi]
MALCLSRVETVLSLQQLLPIDAADPCPECPVADVAKGGCLPLVSFSSGRGFQAKRVRSFGDMQVVPDVDDLGSWLSGSSDDEGSATEGRVPSPPSSDGGSNSLLDTVLLAEWEDRAEQGLFRYDVTACPTKMVPGAYGFVAQFNEGRGSKKRPTEFRVDRVVQPFDSAKFNFTKALQKEVLFQFEAADMSSKGSAFLPLAPVSGSPNLVFINVSPIEYGHVLLVPRALDCLNQLVDPSTLKLALQFAHEAANPYFRLAFNSLGAYGTVNHLHFQAYYMAAPFAVERAPTVDLCCLRKYRGVHVAMLTDYPVCGLVFEASDSIDELSLVVGEACQRLSAANIPHNLFIVDCGQRIFLFPNAFARAKAKGLVPEDLLDSQVDPAAFEISGHIIYKRSQDYDHVSQDAVWRLLSYASYSEADVLEMARKVLAD